MVTPDDYRGHRTHEMYEQTLRLAHGRKTSFWARLLMSDPPGLPSRKALRVGAPQATILTRALTR
jgi:hypothetical protein